MGGRSDLFSFGARRRKEKAACGEGERQQERNRWLHHKHIFNVRTPLFINASNIHPAHMQRNGNADENRLELEELVVRH